MVVFVCDEWWNLVLVTDLKEGNYSKYPAFQTRMQYPTRGGVFNPHTVIATPANINTACSTWPPHNPTRRQRPHVSRDLFNSPGFIRYARLIARSSPPLPLQVRVFWHAGRLHLCLGAALQLLT